MLKKLLFGLTLVSFVGAASAQGLLNKRTSRFNTAKSELKADAKTLDRKVPFDGLHATTARAAVKNIPTGMRRADAAVTSTWFQYEYSINHELSISSNDLLSSYLNQYIGTTNPDSYNMCVRVPARYANAVIDSVCNMFYETATISNCRIWLHNITTVNESGNFPIPVSAEGAEYSMTVNAKDIKGLTEDGYLQMSDFKLNQPFTVGENGCIIGFQFTAPADSLCIVFGGTSVNGGWYHMFNFPSEDDETTSEPGWLNMNSFGNLPIGAHMDVTNCASNNLTANYVVETSLNAGEEGYVGVSVINNAYNAVESLSYILTIDGVAQAEQAMTPEEDEDYDYLVAGGSTGRIFIPCTVDAGEHLVSVEITKVNGNTNEASTKSAEAYVLGLDKPADRVSVIEEATSTSCGYCPRGTVGMEKVKEALGDKVVALSVHGKQSNNFDDPMTCDDYELFLYYFLSDYPTAYINRVEEADPYAGFGQSYEVDSDGNVTKVKFGLDKAVALVNTYYPSEGSIALTAQLSEAEKKITVNTTTTFNVDRESVPYSLVFVLTEDGMTGKDSGTALWTQYNYYSQTFIDYYKKRGYDYSTLFTDSDMDRYKNGSPEYTETYNNVVVGAWGGSTTYEGETYNMCPVIGIPAFEDNADIVSGERMDYSTTLDLSKNTLIQSYRHLKLAVLLLNDNNGAIVNAAQVNLEDPTGIDGAVKDNANSSVVARYSIDGRKLDAPVKGLNIVKMADGRSMKVLVK